MAGVHLLLQMIKSKLRDVIIQWRFRDTYQTLCEDAKNLPKSQSLSQSIFKYNREAPCQQQSQYKLKKPASKVWKHLGERPSLTVSK